MLAEPGALMSFAGPRVVQQTTREKLPEDFGLAESNLRFGHLDAIVARPELRPRSPAPAPLRRWRGRPSSGCASGWAGSRNMPLLRGAGLSRRARAAPEAARADPGRAATGEEIWRSVELARHPDRPYTLDYVERLFDDWFELHGDRPRATTPRSSRGSGGSTAGRSSLVGHQKGRDLKERHRRNFGSAYPEGYRKAMRAMELAERHGFPVVSLVDTPGAYPGRRRRAARPGRRDRALAGADGAPRRADGRLRDRRGRLRRRGRDRARRPGADAGERDLLGDLARGLRRDPLARRRRGEEGGRRLQAGRRATASSSA